MVQICCQNSTLLANRYQIKRLIGRGGMGEVFLADDVLLGKVPVAIKFLCQTFSNPRLQEDFAREARTCAALSQKSIHIVRVTDYGMSENANPFYVMEYLQGKSLKTLIPTPLPMFLNLCRQICLGLESAHQGIQMNGKVYPLVHRDIKPANVLVIPDSTLGQLVKILDFGIAKFLNDSGAISTNQGFYGTLPYCSPEQLEGDELDSRSDIYSLGVMMFEMLTGQKPWQPETDLFGAWYRMHQFEPPRAIAEVNPNIKIPQELNNLIMACLAKSAGDRPHTIAEVLTIVERVRVGKSGGTEEIAPTFSTLRESIEGCGQLTWPKDKPIGEIVFPQLVDTTLGQVGTLLLMLSQQQIEHYAFSRCDHQFAFVLYPYPMLLWVTVLHDRHQELSPQWLPCYLDMQNLRNHQLVLSLIEKEQYALTFFTLEVPHPCTKVMISRIDSQTQQMLKNWLKQSQSLAPVSGYHASKDLLKQQYREIQKKYLTNR